MLRPPPAEPLTRECVGRDIPTTSRGPSEVGGAQIREIKNALEGNKRPLLPSNWDREEKKGNGTEHVSDDSGVCVCLSKRLTPTFVL